MNAMHSTKTDDISTTLRLFASLFCREIEMSLLKEFVDRRHVLRDALGVDLLAELDLHGLHSATESLAVEYCRLFIGPHGHMPPVESVARGEGRFFGNYTGEVVEFYASIGLEPSAETRVPPDHLSVELDCLATLEETGRYQLSGQFARDHVLAWLPKLEAHVTRRARLAFYRLSTRELLAILTSRYAMPDRQECTLESPVQSFDASSSK